MYVVMFTVSAFFLYCSSKCKGNVSRVLLFLVAVALPVLMGTFRSNEVGIDVNVYVKPCSLIAENNSFFTYWTNKVISKIEPGYALLNYIGTKWGGIQGVFFISELLVVFPVYLRLNKEEDISVWLAAFIYLCLFYNMSLNLVRQSIAISIVYFSKKYIGEKKYKIALITIVIGCLFHISAIIGLIYFIIKRASEGKEWHLKQCIVVIGAIIIVAFYNDIFALVIKYILGESSKYANTFLKNDSGYLSFWNIVFNGALIGVVLFNSRYLKTHGKFEQHLLASIFNFVIYLLNYYNGNCFRYALYFLVFTFEVLPAIKYRFVRRNHKIIDIMCCFFVLLYWFNFNVLSNGHGTYPYTSIF